ncbi:MAG TPA: hypothetical protein VIM61_01260 [Chthoniobacterales bacterium]|jgi:hypothetical protein
MFSFTIRALFIGIVGWAIYQFLSPTVETAAVTSPEEQFRQVLSSSGVSADTLARLCDRYPELAMQFLRSHPIQVSGTVQDFFVTGLDGRRALITLSDTSHRKLVAVLDLDHYAVLALEPLANRGVHYLAVGNELLKVTPPGANWGHHSSEGREVVATRSTPFVATVTLDRITSESIIFKTAAR